MDPELGAPVWPGGLDLDPLVLYARALGTGLPLPAEAREDLESPSGLTGILTEMW